MYYTECIKGTIKQGDFMEFNMNRGSQPAARPVQSNTPAAATSNGNKASHKTLKGSGPAWLRVVWVVLLFALTILVVCIAVLLYFGGSKEGNYIDTKKQQAVFLTNGQVYFGKIKEINKQYIDLQNIYYLNVNQQVQPNQKDANGQQAQNNSISLVKLGCELHGPVDQMLINRDQVTFWENLKSDGQVAQAINKWVEQNPNGQKCTTSNNNSNTNNSTNKP
jgi:hypothetical protein